MRQDGAEVPIGSGTQRRILAALLTRVGGGHISTAEFVDALWPEDPPIGATKNVQTYIAKLKRTLGTSGRSAISSGPGGYTLTIAPAAVDAHDFTETVRRARETYRSGDQTTATALLDRAFRLWRGHPYSDLRDWAFLQPEIERLERRRLEALEVGLELGRPDDVLPDLTRLVDENPYQERSVGLLMRALYAAGRQADAQEVFQRARRRLADELGIDPTPELQRLHQALLRGDSELTSSVTAEHDVEVVAGWKAPTTPRTPERVALVDRMPRPPRAFQERTEYLDALRASGSRAPSDRRTPTVVCSVTGPRGVGKTQLAAAYVRSRMSEGWTAVWVDAESRERLVSGLADLADLLGLRQVEEDSENAARRAHRWLFNLEHPGLVVLDNAVDPNLLREWIPPIGSTQVVVTSNRKVFGWLGEHLEVDVFTSQQARTFLTECTGGPSTGTADSVVDKAADHVAEAVGNHPLGLAVAAAVITREQLSYHDYLRRLATLPVDTVLTAHEGDPYPRSIGDAIRLSLAAVEEEEPAARYFAELFAVLSPAGVPRPLMIPDDTDEDSKAARSRILGLFIDASILTTSQNGQTVIMHRLTRRVVRERAIRDMGLSSVIAHATGLLGHRLRVLLDSPDEQHSTRRQVVHEVLGHVEALIDTTDVAELDRSTAVELLDLCAETIEYFHTICDRVRVFPLNRALLTEQERILGMDDPAALRSRSDLASEYRQQGRLDEAILLLDRVLDSQQRMVGVDHSDTLKTRYDLASTHLTAGHAQQAIALLEMLIVDQERVRGADHPYTLMSRKRLAWAQRSLGRMELAIESYEGLVPQFERVLGPSHPLTLRARSELACVCRAAGRLDESIEMLEHNLATCEQSLGTDHPDTRHDRDRLAGTYRAVGRGEEAVRLFEQTRTEWELVLGSDHPWTLMASNNLACAYEAAGQLDAAVGLLEQTLTEYERIVGPDRPRTLNVRNNLACLYYEAGRTAEAVALFAQALAGRERLLGSEHPDTQTTRHNLEIASRTESLTQRREPTPVWKRNHNAYAAGHGVDETIYLPYLPSSG